VALAISTASEDSQTASEPVRPEEFFGDYQIQGELARGGMGVVFRARQVSLNRPVALKMIAAGQLAAPSQVQRFRIEAEAAARLDHPNIVPIFEIGEHQGRHFYSMKLLEGGNLAEHRIEDRTKVALLMAKVARAIHYAHQRGVLHRDLKPTNILIDSRGEPHVTDFGLAKLFDEDTTLTQSISVLGTPAYMAPELASGKAAQATTAADVYSLGAMLYHVLSGQPPFIAENIPALLRRIVEDQPRSIGKGVDRDLQIICFNCLAKDPMRRYSSAQTLAEDLERWLAGEPIQARPAGPAEKLWRWCRRKPALAALWCSLLLALLAGVIGVFSQWQRAETHATEAQQAALQAREQLWQSQLAQARAHRLSGIAGRKNESLAAITSAAAIRPAPELRDDAVAALALTDVIQDGPWQDARAFAAREWAFSPDLDRYALSWTHGEVSIFHMTTGEKLMQLQGPHNSAAKLKFSPNGQLLAAYFATAELVVWNLTNGAAQFRRNLGEAARNSMSFDFSQDQRLLAVASGTNGVRLFDLASGLEMERLPTEGNASRVSFRPDGQALAIGVSSNIFLWRPGERTAWQSLPHPGEFTWFAWHPDGRRLAASCQGTMSQRVDQDVCLWDIEATNCLHLKGHLELVHRVSFNRRGDLLMSTAYDGSTRFWDADSGELQFVSRAGFGLQFSTDDTRIGYSRENQGWGLWKVSASSCYRKLSLPLGSARHILGFDFSPDGRWLVASHPNGVHMFDLNTGAHVASASHRNNHSVWFTPDGERVVLVGRDHLHAWKVVQSGNEVQLQDNDRFEFQPHAGLDAGSMTRGVQHLLTVPAYDQVFCADLGAPGVGWVLQGHGLIGPINSAAISPDTNWIATSYWKDRGTHIWDTRTRQRAYGFGASGGFVTFSPDSRRLLVGSARGYTSWEIGTWRRVWELSRSTAGELPGSGAFSPDGRMIALCPEVNLLQLVEAETGRKIAAFQAPVPKNIEAVAFSPDGRILAAATFDTEIQLWNLRALRQELAKLNLDWQ
jgi:WD40 repeat protein/predicted Ser/Thr protein kinase